VPATIPNRPHTQRPRPVGQNQTTTNDSTGKTTQKKWMGRDAPWPAGAHCSVARAEGMEISTPCLRPRSYRGAVHRIACQDRQGGIKTTETQAPKCRGSLQKSRGKRTKINNAKKTKHRAQGVTFGLTFASCVSAPRRAQS
jgi:hypothetical protein